MVLFLLTIICLQESLKSSTYQTVQTNEGEWMFVHSYEPHPPTVTGGVSSCSARAGRINISVHEHVTLLTTPTKMELSKRATDWVVSLVSLECYWIDKNIPSACGRNWTSRLFDD